LTSIINVVMYEGSYKISFTILAQLIINELQYISYFSPFEEYFSSVAFHQ